MFIEPINDKGTILIYIVIAILILFFFTTIVKIELGHILALIVTIIILFYLSTSQNQKTIDFNTDIEYKLNSLLDKDDLPPDHFYIDADLINLFFNIKQNLAKYNYTNYKQAIITANTLLSIKMDIEKNLCSEPKVPDLTQNFTFNKKWDDTSQYDLKDDTVCSSILTNSYENYQVAEENLKKCMNYMHTFIYVIPGSPSIHRYHEKMMKLLHVPLKRNLDYIKFKYDNYTKKNKLNHTVKIITDYDLPKPMNKYKTSTYHATTNNFNFY